MTTPETDTHVHFGHHPIHPDAIVATVTGPRSLTACTALIDCGFAHADSRTLVLARIDDLTIETLVLATDTLRGLNLDIHIEYTPRLLGTVTQHRFGQTALGIGQDLYDDISHGRLSIHAHAPGDADTTAAVGTYTDDKSVHLVGEDDQRTVTSTYPTTAEALTAFEDLHGDAVRLGPAPETAAERRVAEARASVPTYADGPADHESVLDTFLINHDEWARYSTWDDCTTVIAHESLALRILVNHAPSLHAPQWTIAAYETPVSDRMWQMTIGAGTPDSVLTSVLMSLAYDDPPDVACGSPLLEKDVTDATAPLSEAGWSLSVHGQLLRWQPPVTDGLTAGVQLDPFTARTSQSTSTWTIWSGHSLTHPTWIIRASAYTPTSLLTELTHELAHGTTTRHTHNTPPVPAPPHPAPRNHHR